MTSSATGLRITALRSDHASQVLAIYQQGIDEGNATFETEAPGRDAFDAGKLPEHRHVALSSDGQVLGWTAVSLVSARRAYAGVVEHSVYVHPARRGRDRAAGGAGTGAGR